MTGEIRFSDKESREAWDGLGMEDQKFIAREIIEREQDGAMWGNYDITDPNTDPDDPGVLCPPLGDQMIVLFPVKSKIAQEK